MGRFAGSFADNHITRVYVLPEHQKKGYGTFITKNIETQISEKYDTAYLDASLPAAALILKMVKIGKCHSVPTVLENGKIELSEKWDWTNGDFSKGESLLIEV